MHSPNADQISARGSVEHPLPRRPWQYSLRAMVTLITVTAIVLGSCKTLLFLWPKAAHGWMINLVNMLVALFLCLVLPLSLLFFFAICVANLLSDEFGQTTVSESPVLAELDSVPQSVPGESNHDEPT